MALQEVVVAVDAERKIGFYPGHPKWGGRKRGVPNRNTFDLVTVINERFPGYDPIDALINIARVSTNPLEIRVSCHKEVAKYMYAQKKAIDITGDMNLHEDSVVFVVPEQAVSTEQWKGIVQTVLDGDDEK